MTRKIFWAGIAVVAATSSVQAEVECGKKCVDIPNPCTASPCTSVGKVTLTIGGGNLGATLTYEIFQKVTLVGSFAGCKPGAKTDKCNPTAAKKACTKVEIYMGDASCSLPGADISNFKWSDFTSGSGAFAKYIISLIATSPSTANSCK